MLHDLNLAARYCDRLVLLVNGTVRCTGEPATVLNAQVLVPLYGVRVLPVHDDGCLQLVFGPGTPTIPA